MVFGSFLVVRAVVELGLAFTESNRASQVVEGVVVFGRCVYRKREVNKKVLKVPEIEVKVRIRRLRGRGD